MAASNVARQCFEPCAKTRELARGKLFDGFLDIFGGGHTENITFARGDAKAMAARAGRQSW
jgi:hypothetical protein